MLTYTDAKYLLIDDDGDFSSGATAITLWTLETFWEASADFSDGQYITFAKDASTAIQIRGVINDGIIPGTNITYAISCNGLPRPDAFDPGASDNNVWAWTNRFPDFATQGEMTLDVTFSEPVSIDHFVIGVTSSQGTYTLTTSGGTASTVDFDLTDEVAILGGANGIYDPATGIINLPAQDNGLMIGSTSSNTVTSISITGPGWGSDGYAT